MSSRDATLTIKNDTGYALTHMRDATAVDGMFITRPPSSIAAGSSATFKVGKTSDSAARGPEGSVAYTLTPGATPGQTVTFHWDHPNDSSPSRYWTTSSTDKVTGPTSPEAPAGHDQRITYTVAYAQNALRGNDIVTALSESLLNSQLSYLYGYDVFPHSIEAASGGDRLVISSLAGAPTLTLPNAPNVVDVAIVVDSGVLTTGGVDVPLEGCTFVLRASLALSAQASAATDPGSAAHATALRAQGFTIYQLFTDFTQPSATVLRSVTGVTLTAAQEAAFTSCLVAYTSTRPKWCLALSSLTPDPDQLPQIQTLETFVPVSCELSTTYADPAAGQSSVNLVMMTRGHTPWAKSGRTAFQSPLVRPVQPDQTAVYAVVKTARDQLASGYLEAAVLPVIQQGLEARTPFLRSGLSLRWILADAQDDSAQNGGKGPKTAVDDDFDYYTVTTLWTSADLSLTSPGDGTLVLGGSGAFRQNVTTKQYPLFGVGPSVLLGEVEYQQNFSLTVTIEPGALTIQTDGDVTTTTRQAGQLLARGAVVEGSLDTLKETVGFLQSMADLVNNLFVTDPETYADQMRSKYKGFASKLMKNLDGVATDELGTLTTYMVFPSGPVFSYSGLHLDGNDDMVVNIDYHG